MFEDFEDDSIDRAIGYRTPTLEEHRVGIAHYEILREIGAPPDVLAIAEAYAMACECDEPQPYTRPSGLVICKECGGRITEKPKKRERP